jgi:DNA primase
VSMIPDEIVEQVRDSADLVALVGEAVELKRTGSDYRGPCPFHGGTHRNFAVIPKKNRYYCFVCHASGDVFSWLMKRFGMDYPTAIREAARRSGIVIPESSSRAGPDPREPLFEAVAVAHDWFTRRLLESPEGAKAREYLEGRDIALDVAGQHGLGFAPAGKGFLAAMKELGLADKVLLEAGLTAARDDGTVIPRFRDRLLFPIHDLRGRVVGFGGRLMRPGEPKYLNSPETPIFSKGRQLYNLHQAKAAIRKAESVILVEGYFDVFRLVLAGIEHVVAPLGTALTAEQAGLLRRFAPAATLLYDSDAAGLRATFRAGDELLRHGVRVRVATMPDGEDPDTLVRQGGADALRPILDDGMDLLERKIQLLELKGWFEGVEHRLSALDRLLPTVRAAADPMTRDLYLTIISERTGMSKEVLAQQARAIPIAVRAPAPAPGAPPAARRLGRPFERQLLQTMMAGETWVQRARDEVAPELVEDPLYRVMFEVLLTQPEATIQLPAGLTPEGEALWAELREQAATLARQEVSGVFDRTVQILRARPQYRRLATLKDPGEKSRLRADLRTRYPEADRWYTYQKQRRTRGYKGA